ncbi:MAG: hypothetical protein ABR608_02065 [Pseudonocardiaceae bacterium]
MPERHPGWVTGINDFEARLATGLFATSQQAGDALDPLRARSGIRDAPGNPGLVTRGTNNVTVNPFQAVIQDPARPALGAYLVTLDGPKELPLTAADPSLGRIDLVIAEVDPAVDPGFTVLVVEGERSATPQPPSVTDLLHLRLAQIEIPAAGTVAPTPTDTRQFTAALGGILPVRGNADLPASAVASMFIYRLDTRELQVRQDGAWVTYRPPRGGVDTWHAVTFLNGWVNYGGSFPTAAYTITEDGWVRLRGLVKSGDITKAICTLPPRYRPVFQHIFSVKIVGKEPARLDVTTAGNLIGGGTGDGQISARWTSLDGVSFPTY